MAEEEGADVHGAARAVRRHEVHVVRDQPVETLVEHLGTHFRHGEALAAGGEARGVGARVKDAHLAVLTVVRLQPLEDALAVVQHVRQPVDRHVQVSRERAGVPGAVLPVILDHRARLGEVEPELVPGRHAGHSAAGMADRE